MTEQTMTQFQHNVSFKLMTQVDMVAMESVFENFVSALAARTEAGEELSDTEMHLLELCNEGKFNQAVSDIVRMSFTDYLDSVLVIAAQTVSSDSQSTSFADIKVEAVI